MSNLLGTDFEAFFERDGMVIPALVAFEQQDTVEMEQVFKEIPNALSDEGYLSLQFQGDTHLLIEDGLAFEIPIVPAAEPAILCQHIADGMRVARAVGEDINAALVATPLVYFDKKYLETQAELTVLGCAPDESIYNMGNYGAPPQDPTKTAWRTGGGHIHFSIDGLLENFGMIQSLVMVCDSTLGVADVLLDHGDLSKQRRLMYGQPGKFRIQLHGVEYRTPSNAWAIHPESALLFLSLASEIHQLFINNTIEEIEAPPDIDQAIEVISNCDVTGARDLLEKTQRLYDLKASREIAKIGDLGGIAELYTYDMGGWVNA